MAAKMSGIISIADAMAQGRDTIISEYREDLIEVTDMEPEHSEQQSAEDLGQMGGPTTVYDFYEIDKFFPPLSASGEDVVMPGEEQRLVPIYVCRPLQQVVNMTPLQLQQAEILKELAKIDEASIEILLTPPRSTTDHARKSKLVPLAYVVEKPKEVTTTTREVRKSPKQKPPTPPAVIDIKEEEQEDISDPPEEKKDEQPEKEMETPKIVDVEMKEPPSVEPVIKTEPKDEEVVPSATPTGSQSKSQKASATVICPPTRDANPTEDDTESPQFQCDSCEKRFFLKRALRRHQYTHKK